MNAAPGRVPPGLVALSLLLALFVSGGTVWFVIALWLMWRAKVRGQLKGCLALGCGLWLGLAGLVTVAALTNATAP